MSNTTITDLPVAIALTGAENVALDQPDGSGGFVTRRATTSQIASFPVTAPLLTIGGDPGLPSSRALTTTPGDIVETDGGPGHALNLSLAATAVAAGSYGSSTQVGSFTVDGKGRLTAAASVPIVPGSVSVAANSLVGNATGVTAPATAISIGATFGFSGTTLQTQAGTGDVSWAINSFVTTIGANKVGNSMLAQAPANTLKGNPTGGTANEQDVTLGATLAYSGTALQTTALSGDISSPANSFVTTIGANKVQFAQFQQVSALSIVGNGTNATANVTALSAASDGQVLRRSGTAIGFGALDLTSANSVSGALPAINGGTGQFVYAIGDLLYASTTTALSKLADIATGSALISGGVGVAPSWGKIGLTTHITGTLAVGNGGTGLTAPTAYAVVCGGTTTAGPLQSVASVGTSGQYLGSNGPGALPTFQGLAVSGVALSAGQYPGETSTGNATAGNVGEYVSSLISSGSAVNLTSGSPANITSISLTAGDWDVWVNARFNGAVATTVTRVVASISAVSTTLSSTPGQVTSIFMNGQAPFAAAIVDNNVGAARYSLATTTTIYLVVQSEFAISTLNAFGIIQARRSR